MLMDRSVSRFGIFFDDILFQAYDTQKDSLFCHTLAKNVYCFVRETTKLLKSTILLKGPVFC